MSRLYVKRLENLVITRVIKGTIEDLRLKLDFLNLLAQLGIPQDNEEYHRKYLAIMNEVILGIVPGNRPNSIVEGAARAIANWVFSELDESEQYKLRNAIAIWYAEFNRCIERNEKLESRARNQELNETKWKRDKESTKQKEPKPRGRIALTAREKMFNSNKKTFPMLSDEQCWDLVNKIMPEV